MPAGAIDELPDQEEGMRYVGLLVLWRYSEIMKVEARSSWDMQVRLKAGSAFWAYFHKRESLPGPERWFWQELYNKKVGLFGHGSSDRADYAADLVRHPWVLTDPEFKAVSEKILGPQSGQQNPPLTTPSDPNHVRAIATTTFAFAAGAVAARATARAIALRAGAIAAGDPEPITKAISAAIAVGSLTVLASFTIDDLVDSSKWNKLQRQLKDLRTIYIREADFRAAERT